MLHVHGMDTIKTRTQRVFYEETHIQSIKRDPMDYYHDLECRSLDNLPWFVT